jgi:hypothetical protein
MVLLGFDLKDVVGAGQNHVRTNQAPSPDNDFGGYFPAEHHSHRAEGILMSLLCEVSWDLLLLPKSLHQMGIVALNYV